MNRLALLTLSLLIATPAFAQTRPSKNVPALPKMPKLDGDTKKDFAKAFALKKVEQGSASFTTRVGYVKTTLLVGIDLTDDNVTAGDGLEVMIQFPDAGTTAGGYRYRFAFDGKRTAEGEFAAPLFAQEKVTAGVKKTADGLSLEIALPAEALPRFPAFDPMVFDLCITYEDRDQVGANATNVTNCSGASMGKEGLRLPDDFRKKLGLKPSDDVVGVERHEHGWVGFGMLPYPIWAYGDAGLTPESLTGLVTDEPADAAAALINLQPEMEIGKNKLLSVLSGKNPYAEEGKCNAEHELRLGLYLVKGRTADRVLDWPAATCALGRASSVVLEDDGALVIGYSNGTTSQFAWTGTKFERTEIGKR